MTTPRNAPEVRRRAWATRRKKYGARGHSGAYRRCSGCGGGGGCGGFALLLRLLREGTLSEGQIASACGLHRIDVRRAADEAAR